MRAGCVGILMRRLAVVLLVLSVLFAALIGFAVMISHDDPLDAQIRRECAMFYGSGDAADVQQCEAEMRQRRGVDRPAQ